MNKFDQTYNLIMESLQTEGVRDFLFSIKNLVTRQRKHNRITDTYGYGKSGRKVRQADIQNGTIRRKVANINGTFLCYNLKKLTNLERGPNEVYGDYIVDSCPNFRFFSRTRATYVHGRVIINNCPKLEDQFNEFVPYSDFTKNNNLTFSDGKWNSSGDVKITNADLVDGKLPYNFGIINGNFDCQNCDQLDSLEGMPTQVIGISNFDGCTKMPNYADYLKEKKDSAAKVKREQRLKKFIQDFVDANDLVQNSDVYDCNDTITITDKDLINGQFPVKFGTIKGDFMIDSCKKLKSLEGAPNFVNGDFYCVDCSALTSIQHSPRKVDGFYALQDCKKVKSLKGLSIRIGKDFICRGNGKTFTDKDVTAQGTKVSGTCKFV